MPATEVAADWTVRGQIAKKLFPIYMLFCERFGMPGPPVADARSLKVNPEPALIESVEHWMDDLDRRIDAFQMRSVVQGSNVGASELRILALLERLLSKPNTDAADQSKIDFLLAQFLATHLSLTPEQTPTLAEVADALEPVIGKVANLAHVPALESLTWELLSAQRLAEVQRNSIIQRGREAKKALGDKALLPENLVACSRFNFLLRKRCFELMREEVRLIDSGLKTLAERGVKTLDCQSAHLSAAEAIPELVNLCKTWQEGKPYDYTQDHPFGQVIALQEIVEKALAEPKNEPATVHAAASAAHVDERFRPTPDVIQVYAEFSALRREHQEALEHAQQQEARALDLQNKINQLQAELALQQERWAAITKERNAAEDFNAALPSKFEESENALTKPSAAPVTPPQEEKEEQPASVSQSTTGEHPEPVPEPAPDHAVPPPAATPQAPKQVSIQEIVQTLANRMEQLRKILTSPETNTKKDAPSHLKINHVSIMLTASETQAFIAPSSAADDLICRGVAARFLLLELSKDTERETARGAHEAILNVCEAGAAQLQEQAVRLPADQAERVRETAKLLVKTLKGLSGK